MLIAFEGPDNVGKSYSAEALSAYPPIYNATKGNYPAAQILAGSEKGTVLCFDRIDWLTHMVYRLAMPDREWNDARIRTVFAMPDTHLVFKEHHPSSVPAEDREEGYPVGAPTAVSAVYSQVSRMIMSLNEMQGYNLFKTVTIMEVSNNTDPDHGGFYQRIKEFSSPLHTYGTVATKLVHDEVSLLEFLLEEDKNR